MKLLEKLRKILVGVLIRNNISIYACMYFSYSVSPNILATPDANGKDAGLSVFCTIRVFIPYAYGTYHTRIRIWYNHTRMVRIIVPYAYGAYETPLVLYS